MDPPWPPTGWHSTEIIFHIHVTFDLWWLYINVDWWLINVSLTINLLICNLYPYTICIPPCTNEWGKYAVGKVLGKILKWIKHYIFFVWNMLFSLFTKKNNHQLKYFSESKQRKCKIKLVIVSSKWHNMKINVLPLIFKPNIIFQFFFC